MRPVAMLVLFLAAWGPATSSARAQPSAPGADGGWQFRCPDAGTVVERSGDVARLVFRGADPAVPLVCRSGQRSPTSRVLGLWRLDSRACRPRWSRCGASFLPGPVHRCTCSTSVTCPNPPFPGFT